MTTINNTRNILLVGKDLHTWFSAACLVTMLPQGQYQIYVMPSLNNRKNDRKNIDDDLVIRPKIKRLHRQFGLQEHTLAEYASAKPLFATPLSINEKVVHLPFGDYGIPNNRAAFHHHWLKAKRADSVKPLNDYNLALRLTQQAFVAHNTGTELPKTDYGYLVKENAYSELMKHIALNAGVKQITHNFTQFSYSQNGLIEQAVFDEFRLAIDLCFGFVDVTEKNSSYAHLDDYANGFMTRTSSFMSGIALQQVHNSLNRLMAFWPNQGFTPTEKHELKRINDIEAQRVADMAIFLSQGVSNASASLQRKYKAFAHRGLIPQEDYELFSQAEWISAMLFRNVEPNYYDRLADTVSVEESISFVKQVGGRIDAFVQQDLHVKRQA